MRRIDDDPNSIRIFLETDGSPPKPFVFTLSEPERLVIDLPQLANRFPAPSIAVSSPHARTVRIGEHGDFTRVVIDAGGASQPFSRWRLERRPNGWHVGLGVDAPAQELPSVSAGPTEGKPPGASPAPTSEREAPPGRTAPAKRPTRIYGLDLSSEEGRDRLLVFAEHELTPEVDLSEKGRIVVDFPSAHLDPSAPSRLAPRVGRGVSLVLAFEKVDTATPTVRLVIDYAGDGPPTVSKRGAILALNFQHSIASTSGLTLEFREAPLADVVRAIGEATGNSFTHDRLEGRVSISGSRRLHPEEAMELLHAALLLRGYAAVAGPSGIFKILPIESGQAGGPWVELDGLEGVAPMTTLVQLRHASPTAVVDALRGWFGPRLVVLPYPRTNSVILSGSAERLERLVQVVRALDESSDSELLIKRLRHRDASDAAALLQDSFEGRPGEEIRILSDERTNAVLLHASRDRIDGFRSFLDRIDIPVEGGGEIHVLRLHAADPEELAARLLELRKEPASDRRGALAAALQERDFHVTADPPTRSLLIRSDPATFQELAALVSELDQVPPRIRLELLVFEVNSTGSLSLGFDAFTPISRPSDANDVISTILVNPSGGGPINPGAPGGPNGTVRFTREPLIIPILGPGGIPISVQVPRESFVITADAATLAGRILMRPNLLMVAGEEHELFAGANVPIPSERDGSSDALARLQTQVDIDRRDVGLLLRVTPKIGLEGSVDLDLFIEETRVIPSLVAGGNEQGVSLAQRRVETKVILYGGEYAVVALSKEQIQRVNESGVPYIMNIPLLGHLAKATRDTDIERQFVVAVRARVLRNNLEVAADSIRERVGFERSLARASGLTASGPAIFGVRVRTVLDREEAEEVARSLRGPEGPGRIVAWEWEGEERFDVVLTGYRDLVAASSAVVSLEEAGWFPEVIPLRELPPAAAAP